jgi:hypothetical protein
MFFMNNGAKKMKEDLGSIINYHREGIFINQG